MRKKFLVITGLIVFISLISLSIKPGERSLRDSLKTVVIGLDGADWRVINPLIEQEKLPNIARLIRSGYSGGLKSVKPAVSPPAWASMITGTYPQTHGLDFFSFCEDKRKNIAGCIGKTYLADSTFVRKKSFFDILGEAGKSVGILFVPFVGFPVWEVNGVMLGIPKIGHRPDIPDRFGAYPEKLLEELPVKIDHQRKCIFDKPKEAIKYSCDESELLRDDPRLMKSIKSYDQLINPEKNWIQHNKEILQRIYNLNRKKNVGKYIISQFSPDVFMLVFDETDDIQHFYWKYLDRKHPAFDFDEAKNHNKLIEYMYVELDRAIGELLEPYDDNVLVVIASDHGFGAHFQVNLKQLMDRIHSLSGVRVVNCNKELFTYNPPGNLPKVQFCLPYAGTVSKSNDAAVINSILTNITFSDGSTVFRNIRTSKGEQPELTAQINLRGFYGQEEKIIILQWDGEKVEIPLIDLIENIRMNGYHRDDGIYILNGPMIGTGKEDRSIVDIAPTIQYAMGQVIPEAMEGKIILNAFSQLFKEKYSPLISKYPTDKEPITLDWATPEIEKDVNDRLKSLGYIQ